VELRVRTQLALYDQNRELERRVAERTKELSDTIQQLRETTAAKERIESELAIAGQIQRAMLPKTDLTDAVECGYRLSAFLQPARQVGGDLYDFFLLDTGWLCLAIGDVSDKGVPAALTMARVITLIRAIAKLNSTPAAILEAINIALCHENDDCHFVTLLCGILEISTGTLHYASGGHDAPLLLRNKHNSWIQLETGPALGIFPNASFPNQRIQLEANDLLLFFTDGLTEAKNLQGNQFTASRLTELLSRHPANDPTRLIRSIQVFYNDFIEQGPASDDITLLALQYLPTHPAYLKHTTMQCTITINNELTELAQVRKRLGEILLQENISKSIIEDMQLVVEELLVNIIEYAFTDTTSTQQLINVHLNITETAVSFKFEDSGKPFNPLEEVTTPDLSVSAEERTNGGLGFFLVRKLVDHIHYARQEDKNVLLVSRNTANPT
jgi:sigma-B regulation protein RsbU (phosphoserine phosphatase)